MLTKKPLKSKKAVKIKVTTPTISAADRWKKKMDEATDLNKKIEYRFWMETAQGKNPQIPEHMR